MTDPRCIDHSPHNFVHLETIKKEEYAGYQTRWMRLERFYCSKCLQPRETKFHEWSKERPDWWT